jgi:hypothetical protein
VEVPSPMQGLHAIALANKERSQPKKPIAAIIAPRHTKRCIDGAR